jgi:hypothetical protein
MQSLTVLLIMLACIPAFGSETGTDLLRKCGKLYETNTENLTTVERLDSAYCMGFINGVAQANDIWWEVQAAPPGKGEPDYCIVDGVVSEQVYLQDWRELRLESAPSCCGKRLFSSNTTNCRAVLSSAALP